jgi:hypothetical protein
MKFEHIGGNFQHGQKSTIWTNLNLNTLWGKKLEPNGWNPHMYGYKWDTWMKELDFIYFFEKNPSISEHLQSNIKDWYPSF